MSERTWAELRRLKAAGGDPRQWIEPRTWGTCDWCQDTKDIRNNVCEQCEDAGRVQGDRQRVIAFGRVRMLALVLRSWREVLLWLALAGMGLLLWLR